MGANPIAGWTYQRDKLGRITQQQETVQGVVTTYDYAYDLAGRLAEVRRNGQPYAYDGNGSRTEINGQTVANYDDQDRLASHNGNAYTYTENGELKTKTIGAQTTAYSYDVAGNLRQATLPDGRQISYLIDGQNRRVGKQVNGTLVQGFLYQLLF